MTHNVHGMDHYCESKPRNLSASGDIFLESEQSVSSLMLGQTLNA